MVWLALLLPVLIAVVVMPSVWSWRPSLPTTAAYADNRRVISVGSTGIALGAWPHPPSLLPPPLPPPILNCRIVLNGLGGLLGRSWAYCQQVPLDALAFYGSGKVF